MRPPGPTWSEVAEPRQPVVFEFHCDTPRSGWHTLACDGEPLLVAHGPDELLLGVDRALNAAAVAHLGQTYLLLHAGAVARGGQGLVLPARSGAGKSTLVAGLLAAGFDYLSDEVAIFDVATGRLLPFPKCLGIKAGSRRVLRPQFPALAGPARRVAREALWHLAPPAGAWPTGPVRLAAVVVPQYVPRARPRLEPIPPREALQALLDQAANVHAFGGDGIALLVAVLRGAETYALTGGNLGQAVQAVQQLAQCYSC